MINKQIEKYDEEDKKRLKVFLESKEEKVEHAVEYVKSVYNEQGREMEKKDEKDLRNYMEVNLKMVDEIESDFEINLAEITVDEKSQIKMKHLDEYTEKEKYNRMKSKQNTRKMAREYEDI